LQVFYKTQEEAHHAIETGQNIAFLWITANFSKTIPLFNDDPDFDYNDEGFVQVFLDKTDLQKAALVERELLEAYERFIESVMVDCGKSSNAGKLIVTTKALIGSMNFEFRKTFLMGFIFT
jgi:hypothetical protein